MGTANEIMAIRAMLHAYILTTLDTEQLKRFTEFVKISTVTVNTNK